jgi:hypothetical protein
VQLIFFDTTALHKGWFLRGPRWDVVRAAAMDGRIQAAVSEASIQELVRQAEERVTEIRKDRNEHDRDFESLGLSAPHSDPGFDKVRFEANIRERFNESRIEILPLPGASLQEILVRDLSVTPPFQRSGKGFRDTLIWLTLVEWHSGEGELIFVTANTKDFCENGKLAPQLVHELPEGSSVRVVPSMDSLVTGTLNLLPVREASTTVDAEGSADVADDTTEGDRILQALLSTEKDLLGTSVSLRDSSSPFGLRVESANFAVEIEDATVEGVELDTASVKLFQYEFLSGTTELWNARIDATLRLVGYVHKSDLGALPHSAEVTDSDWNRRYAEVSISLDCELIYDVRVEVLEESASAELTEIDLQRT